MATIDKIHGLQPKFEDAGGGGAADAPVSTDWAVEKLKKFKQLQNGISQEEIKRAKVGLKSALILQSESSSSRAGAIAGDYYMLGRVRSLQEIKTKIEQPTVNSVLEFLRNNSFKDFTVVTIGPQKITL